MPLCPLQLDLMVLGALVSLEIHDVLSLEHPSDVRLVDIKLEVQAAG